MKNFISNLRIKYVIGEFLIIVLGITCAFYLENWRVSIDDKKIEIEILQQLVWNLDKDISDLSSNIRSDSKTSRSHEIIINQIENKLSYDDSLSTNFGHLARYTMFFNNSSAYENLKSIGFRYISNDSLRNAIINYYEVDTRYLLEVEEFVKMHEDDIVHPSIIKNFNYSSFFEPAYPNNYDKLIADAEFKSIIQTTKRLFKWKIRRSNICNNSASHLRELILSEIQILNN